MSVTGRKVHETAFSDDIYCPAVLQFVCFDVVSCRSVADSHFFQCRHGNFHVEMSCVAADGSVFHLQEMLCSDDIIASGDSHEDVALCSGF